MKKLGAIFCITLAACGGGGGSDGGNYSGIWDFSGPKRLDDCNSNAQSTLATSLNVAQSGSSVVVQSGNITLSGSTNSEDGFDVSASGTSAEGCALGYAYIFKNASDGVADAGLGVAANCGAGTCTVAYGGPAVKRGSRMLSSEDLSIVGEELSKKCGRGGEIRSLGLDVVDSALNAASETINK